jgi:sulfide dehydrogenase cytochrome subunit
MGLIYWRWYIRLSNKITISGWVFTKNMPNHTTHPMKILPLFSLSLLMIGAVFSAPGIADVLDQNCDGCHGSNGVSTAPYIPTIAGLNFRYFYTAMQAFKKDRRRSSIMGRIAKGYKTSQLQLLALHYGRQPWEANSGGVIDRGLAQRGQELHRQFCEKCHKEGGLFQDKDTPPLAGQAKGYLLLQMLDYRTADTVMPQPPLMQERLEKLGDEDLRALSEFFAGRR